jgi:chemotaxis protein CheD
LEPTAVTTVLGSCVSVCLFDVGLQCGGMNHFLLPFWCGNSRSPGRFGNEATQALLARLLALGGRRESIQAKVFGGACVIDALRRRHGQLGDQNVARALEALEAEGIPVVARDTDGERGRKLVFHTDTGDAWVKVL